MKLDVKGFAAASGVLWGAAVGLVAIANLIWPAYGRDLLQVVASIYPGYHPGGGAGSVIVATLYGVVDAAIAGAVFAVAYNLFATGAPR